MQFLKLSMSLHSKYACNGLFIIGKGICANVDNDCRFDNVRFILHIIMKQYNIFQYMTYVKAELLKFKRPKISIDLFLRKHALYHQYLPYFKHYIITTLVITPYFNCQKSIPYRAVSVTITMF